jgi:hypothetical protein
MLVEIIHDLLVGSLVIRSAILLFMEDGGGSCLNKAFS